MLLGWVASQGAQTLPTIHGELYDQVLGHEENYWSTVYRDTVGDRQPRRARLRAAAVCLSLVAAPEQHADAVLTAVTDLEDDPRERRNVRDTLITCLRPAPGEGLALRPEPVGDHLVLRELRADQALLLRTIEASDPAGLPRALITLVRAGQNDPDTATRLITRLLEDDVGRWPEVLAIALAQGGSATSSLEQLACRSDTPLPLDELSTALPFSSLRPYQLALSVDQRRLEAARAAGVDQAVLAELLERGSARATLAGDRSGALAPITEAVQIRRRLAEANPAAYLPDLAASLNNLSLRQSDTGDRAGALTSITEAVEHYQRLAQANPAAYLPDLAMSLNNLSDQLTDAGHVDQIGRRWRTAISALESPAAHGELRAAWARRLSASGRSQDAWAQLRHAAEEADQPPTPDRSTERAGILILRARQAVRFLAQELRSSQDDDELPIWASAALPAEHLNLVSAYASADEWPAQQAALDDQRALLTSAGFRTTLRALDELYPANPVPALLLGLLDEIDESSIDAVFAHRRADHERRDLLTAWIDTPTWTDSLAFLREHHAALTSEESTELLAGANDDTARQHLVILNLAGALPIEQVYAIVTAPGTAEEAALDALDAGDLPRLGIILTAAPDLQSRPITRDLIVAVLLLAQGEPDQALGLGRHVAELANPLQRRAHTIRLRGLRTHHPDLPSLDQLIRALDPEAQPT